MCHHNTHRNVVNDATYGSQVGGAPSAQATSFLRFFFAPA